MELDRSSEPELNDDAREDEAGGDYSSSRVTSDCAATSDDDDDDDDDDDKDDEEDDDNDDEIPIAVPVDGGDDESDARSPSSSSGRSGRSGHGVGGASSHSPPPPPPSSAATFGARHSHENGGGERQGRGSFHLTNSRSAAAAHRNRQVHVPPIGSPGLLMIPAPANALEEADRRRHLIVVTNDRTGELEEYFLPSTVYRESMVAGGYTMELRRGSHGTPSRGSSTERTVGDMFDCDAGPGMYIHFPDLVPKDLWDRRIGDEEGKGERMGQMRGEGDDGLGGCARREGGGDGLINGAPLSDLVGLNASSSSTHKVGPKGARSSYIFFTNEQRPLVMAQFPAMKFTEQGVIMGERWRALTPEEKRPYEEMANADKERHARETREYIEGVRREVEVGIMQTEDCSSIEGPLVAKQGLQDVSEMGVRETFKTIKKEGEIRGPRLVDAVILSLSRMLGDKSSKRTVLEGAVPTAVMQTDDVTSCIPAHDDPNPLITREVTQELTLDELPRFTPPSTKPQTRPHPRPHAPMSFLDMIPVSLTATYPASYVAKRRAYALAVQAREEAIVAAQEAKDDADDAEEKYLAHVEAWERMLEYQKGQIAKRELEWKREKESLDAPEKESGNGSSDNGRKAVAEGSDDFCCELDEAMNGGDGGGTSGNDGCNGKKDKHTTPPPEDPMDCMPPRPQRPGPPRTISIPDIPTPPSPPPIVMCDGESDLQVEMNGIKCDSSVVPMLVPKVDQKLVKHLDQTCFLPTMLGRYLGLLSNHIADPQFCGTLAPGVVGNTVGGGTGLATSYPGGGRGPVPVRGGVSSWHHSVAMGGKSGMEQLEKKSYGNDKAVIPDEIASFEQAASMAASFDPSSAPMDSSPMKEKRNLSDANTTPPSDNKNKKQKRSAAFLLSTGDRNTSATEIASGSAGPEFPDGWLIKTYRRSGGETIGKTDRFWFSPGRNIRFRAKKHAKAFVAVLNEPGIEGDEDKAAEIFKTRGLHF
ncbi:hypothetical protein ACHAXA_000623 [Cyclostephanos tholiformis]|uniref:HMG box domain-containing protein n=1 Tax=Cyclostephanos tholiformis TaxID=382380 RepID=A0ABD3SQH4_9STRA